MSKNIINDKKALDELIIKSINPTFRYLFEDPQQPVAPQPQQNPAQTPPPGDGANQVSVNKVATGTPGTTTSGNEDLTKGTVTLEIIVAKLNSVRAGHSFKDENIFAQMQEYFDDLNDNEKLALYAFLKGIAQIVTGEVAGEQAAAPSTTAPELEVTEKGDGMKNIRHVKPNIVKSAPPVQAGANRMQSKENTSAPLPITPKQR